MLRRLQRETEALETHIGSLEPSKKKHVLQTSLSKHTGNPQRESITKGHRWLVGFRSLSVFSIIWSCRKGPTKAKARPFLAGMLPLKVVV